MGLLSEAREITAFLHMYVGDGSGSITVEGFHEAYMNDHNQKQKLKIDDLSIYQARTRVEKVLKQGFIGIHEHNNVQDYMITSQGYELMEKFGKVPTGIIKVYMQKNSYITVVISSLALLVAMYAAIKPGKS